MTALFALTAAAWTAPWISIPPASDPIEKAQWIWVQPNGGAKPTTGDGAQGTFTFSKVIVTSGGSARLRFTADNTAVILINHEPIARSESWNQLTDTTVVLQKGQNLIEAQVTNTVVSTPVNPGGFVLLLEAKDKQVRSDETWSVSGGKAVSIGPFNASPWGHSVQSPAPPVMRKEFSLSKTVKSAVVKVIGLGDYVLDINGKRVGTSFANQSWTQYDKRLLYRTFDVSKLVRKGANAIGAMLGNSFYDVAIPPGNGWYKGDLLPHFGGSHPYALSLQLDVTYTDGTNRAVTTDGSWKFGSGPITFSHIYAGENYDARLEQPGWDKPGFAARNWKPVEPIPAPKVIIEEQKYPPIEIVQGFKPIRIIKRAADRWSYDFIQNCSGIPEMIVTGKAGQEITLKPSEVITDRGDVVQMNLWGRTSLMKVTLKGAKDERWMPTFFYHGQKAIEVRGAVPAGQPNPNHLPVIKSLILRHTRANNRRVGEFKPSFALYDKTENLIDWAVKSNMAHVMTDCPHREKNGWLECSYLLAPSFSYMYDTHQWMLKATEDIRDAQLPNGIVQTMAPMYGSGSTNNPFVYTVEWGAASVMLPWHLYTWYGDKNALSQNFASMKAFTDQIMRSSRDHIAPGGLGDWYDYGHGQAPGPSRFTPQDLSATATYAMCLDICANTADILGGPEETDSRRYRTEWEFVKRAFQAKFYDPIAKTCRNNGSCQAGNSMALEAHLIPDEDRKAVLDNIVKDLEQRGYQQTPGDVGHVYFIRALAHGGRSDVLHKVYSRTTIGSYGGILAKGLTALPETWDAMIEGSNSLNHCMLGHVIEWFYGYALGIRQAEGSVGWKNIVFAPVPGGRLTAASGSVETPLGKAAIRWNMEGGFHMTCTVPKGTYARLIMPFGKGIRTVPGGEGMTEEGTEFRVMGPETVTIWAKSP